MLNDEFNISIICRSGRAYTHGEFFSDKGEIGGGLSELNIPTSRETRRKSGDIADNRSECSDNRPDIGQSQ